MCLKHDNHSYFIDKLLINFFKGSYVSVLHDLICQANLGI